MNGKLQAKKFCMLDRLQTILVLQPVFYFPKGDEYESGLSRGKKFLLNFEKLDGVEQRRKIRLRIYDPYTPCLNGKRISKNVYAKTREECEQKLAELIVQMKAEIAKLKKK